MSAAPCAQRARRLIVGGIKVGSRRLVAVEFEHDVSRPRLSLERFMTPAARERPSAMGGDHLRGCGGITRVGVRILDVDARNDIAFGHWAFPQKS